MIDNLIFIQNELDKLEKEKINLQKKLVLILKDLLSFYLKIITIILNI